MNKKKSFKSALKYARELNENKVDITEDLHDWKIIGLSIVNSFGEVGREMFHIVTSANEEDYDKEETDQMYTECLQANERRDPKLPRVTIATFVMMARKGLKKLEVVNAHNEDDGLSYDGD